jgi:hypothetical protein
VVFGKENADARNLAAGRQALDDAKRKQHNDADAAPFVPME